MLNKSYLSSDTHKTKFPFANACSEPFSLKLRFHFLRHADHIGNLFHQ